MAKNRDIEADAFEIRKRAERRLGEMMEAQRKTIGLARPGGDMRPEHRVTKKPDAVPTLAEAGIDKNLAHRARIAAVVSAEKFEQMISGGRERIATASDRFTVKLLKASAPTKRPNNKCSDRSGRQTVDDQSAPSTHAECVNLADLRSCWDDSCVAGAVRLVIGEALQSSDAPKLPAPQETRELLRTLRESIEQLEPATEITKRTLRPAEPAVIVVLDNIIRELEATDLQKEIRGRTSRELHDVKRKVSKISI